MDNIFDVLARKLRVPFFVACIAAVPVFALSYIHMLKLLYAAAPTWAFIGIGVCHMLTFVAFGLLHDFRREKQNLPPYYQQTPPADQ